jgi:hypothetical protein
LHIVQVKMTRDEFNAKAAQLKAEQAIVLSDDKGVVSKDARVEYLTNWESSKLISLR